jgi:SPP1 family phage portal protein
MNGDVKNTIKILDYPKQVEFQNLTDEEIISLIQGNKSFEIKYQENLDYYISKNRVIGNKRNVDPYNPDSRVTVSNARTMTQTVKGYMYKPGLISYESADEAYMENLQRVFDFNNEPLISSELGENQSKYGLGVELNFIDVDENNAPIVRFTSVKPNECVFVFNHDVVPKLIGAIRYYITKDNEETREKVFNVEVYYLDHVDQYTMVVRENKITLTLDTTYENFFNEIPFSLYINNNEYHADYEPVKTLVDAYDILTSDSVNEITRFAASYLILKDHIFSNPNDDNEKRLELEKLKTRRVLEFFNGEGGAEFLTKDIPSEFFKTVREALMEDIEKHSHVPDFRGETFQSKSGIAMQWALVDFENLCGDKQAWFEVGLRRRIRLINNFFKIKATDTAQVNIMFERNTPANNNERIQQVVALKQIGLLADVTCRVS